MSILGMFRKNKPRIKEKEQDEYINQLINMNEREMKGFFEKLYPIIGKQNFIRIYHQMTRRATKFAKDSSDGDVKDFAMALLKAEENDGSELGLLLTRTEALMRFCNSKGISDKQLLMENNHGIEIIIERAEDRLGLQPKQTEAGLVSLFSLILMGGMSETDVRSFVGSVSGAAELMIKYEKKKLIGNSAEQSVSLLQSTGMSVEKASQLKRLALEYIAEIEEEAARKAESSPGFGIIP